MCDPAHEARLIAEYCGDEALLEKMLFEQSSGLQKPGEDMGMRGKELPHSQVLRLQTVTE